MSNVNQQAQQDANNGKSGVPPKGLSQQLQQAYQRAFSEQKSRNADNKK